MLLEQTKDKLLQLRLNGMLKALEEQENVESYRELDFNDRFGHLVDSEYFSKENKRLQSRIRQAKFKVQCCLEDVDYRASRGLNKSVILTLSTCKWINDHQNLIITGATGLGKSYLSMAFGHRACVEGFKVLYLRLPRFFSSLNIARGDGSYSKVLNSLAKVDLLILDDWGLKQLNDFERRDLLEVLEDRYELKSTVITSQVPVKEWHGLIGESTIADAILDRLVHNSHRINLKGESLRKSKKNTKGLKEKAELDK